jgi:hypothetical protein
MFVFLDPSRSLGLCLLKLFPSPFYFLFSKQKH